MKKSLFWGMFAVLTMAVGMSSCNSNYENSEPISEPISERLKKPSTISQATFQTDCYQIDYCLRNENGTTTSTFKQGENIYFDVMISNTTEYDLHLGEEREILYSAASIFRSNGEYVGNPFDGMSITQEYRMMTIKPHANTHWWCPWTFDEKFVSSLGYNLDFNALSLKKLLPKGTYYSRLKAKVEKRILVDSAPDGEITGLDDIELKIPFVVE